MGEHKLKLSEETRIVERKRFNELKRLPLPYAKNYLTPEETRQRKKFKLFSAITSKEKE